MSDSENHHEIQSLLRTILWGLNEFQLIFVECEWDFLKAEYLPKIRAELEKKNLSVDHMELSERISNFVWFLEDYTQQKPSTDVLFLSGLEKSILPTSIDDTTPFLNVFNLGRNLFPEKFPHPLIIWLPSSALARISRETPDTWSWRRNVAFLSITPNHIKKIESNISGLLGAPFELIHVPNGTFEMGDHFGVGLDDEKPVHSVTLSEYLIAKYAITMSQYGLFCQANIHDNGKWGRENRPVINVNWGRENCPVINVNWVNAGVFCRWVSAQLNLPICLPTEAQWEYAARSKGKEERWAGTNDRSSLTNYAWYDENSNGSTHPVGEKMSNGLGLYDMGGNVWEWCYDWYDDGYYQKSLAENPMGPLDGKYRVLRGGSWRGNADYCRTTYRYKFHPNFQNYQVGFRIVLSSNANQLNISGLDEEG